MAVDEENSIYVGGLPYDASEETLRRTFDYYGTIIAVKVINDQKIRGKCYGFVTFTNPRSAEDAIMDMDGKRIGGRVVRVNEVRTRGGRPDFGHDIIRRDAGRDSDWDRGRGRERNYSRDRDYYRDRDSDRSRDRDGDRDRDYDHGRSDQERDRPLDRSRDQKELDQERARDEDREWEGDRNIDWDSDREKEKSKGYDNERDKEKEQQSRKRFRRPKGRDSRELSSSSADDYRHDVKVKDRLDKAIQMHDDLQVEVTHIKQKIEVKEQLISDLQKKSQKLEDALAAAQKISLQRQSMVKKVYKCFLQLQDCNDKVKVSEKELQSLVADAIDNIDMAEDAAPRDGSIYANGQV